MLHAERMRRPLLALAAILALTGCVVQPPALSSSPTSSASAEQVDGLEPAPPVAPVEPGAIEQAAYAEAPVAWRRDALLLSTPVVVGDVALAYESGGGSGVALTALSILGDELWSVPAEPFADGPLAEPIPLGPASSAVVPVLVAEGEGVRWAVLDVRTGVEPVWASRSLDGSATTWPAVFESWRCLPEPEQSSLCFSVDDGTGVTVSYLRVDLGRGIETAPLWARGRIVASDAGLYVSDAGERQLLSERALRWSLPWDEVLRSEPVPGGVRTRLVDDVLVVEANPGWVTPTYEGAAVDVAGIHELTGEVLWQRPATSVCGVDEDVVVLCELDATVDPFVPSMTLRALTLHGVDVASGEELWTQSVGQEALDQARGGESWQRWGSGDVLLLDDGGPTLVDAATGERLAIDDAAAMPCSRAGEVVSSWGSWEEMADVVRWCGGEGVDERVAAAVGVGMEGLDERLVLVVEELELVAYAVE